MLSDIFRNVFQRSQSFKRNSWKGVEDSFVAESFLREAEYHHWSRSHPVRDDFAGFRYRCLSSVDVEYIKTSGAQYPMDDLQLSFVSPVCGSS